MSNYGIILQTPYVAPKRVAICNRNRAYTQVASSTVWQSGTYQTAHMGLPCGVSALQSVWGNYVSPLGVESVGANNVPVDSTLYYGGYNRWTSSASNSWSVTPGATVTTDTMALRIPGGCEFFQRQYVGPVTAGQSWPMTFPPYATEGGNQAAGTVADLTGGGTIGQLAATTGNSPYAPMIITGIPDQPIASWGFFGDSITYGQGDSQFAMAGTFSSFGLGWPDRALLGRTGSVNFGTQGDQIALFAGTGSQYRLGGSMLSYLTHATLMYGRNDLSAGISAAVFLADLAGIISTFTAAGVKCYPCTILPKSSSTDNWATLVNQTVGSDATRVTINTAIRAGISGASGYFETANAVENAQDTGVWKVNGLAFGYTGDGTHPSPTGYAAIAAAVGPSMSLVP